MRCITGTTVAVLVGKYAAGATLGTLLVAYGLQEFLSATGHSWFRYTAY
ncbi:hypothetical protein [Natronobacterium gregoryi]|nr:hypothetical protein [Natronobacterium gregoryi]